MMKQIAGICLVLLIALNVHIPVAVLTAGSFESGDAAFKVNSTTYELGTMSTTWKSELGKYNRTEQDACYLGEKAYLYNFTGSGVKIETLVKDESDTEIVIGVIITGTTVETAGGLKIGHAVTKMESIYGTDYKKSGSTYTYSADGKQMVVTTSKDNIIKITLIQ